ncbi:MAG: flagellar hook capping FlgD N-terminal domain-containing protein [Pseudolabrys sp.]
MHGTGTSSVSGALDNEEIASNFTMFLQLLTTQLKNQNPLDPLDTNQFTQQLVQFAQVEQQMKSNDLLCGPSWRKARKRPQRLPMSAQRWWSMDRRHGCQWPGEVDLECQ